MQKEMKRRTFSPLLLVAIFLFAIIVSFNLGVASIANNVFHDLQSVTKSSAANSPSVDTDTYVQGTKLTPATPDGKIDVANIADYALISAGLTGTVTNNAQIKKGCARVDTGLGFTGYTFIDLTYVGGVNVGENICEDSDGCWYTIVSYDANYGATNTNVMNGGTGQTMQFYYQFPRVYASGIYTARWVSSDGTNTGETNGNTVVSLIKSWDNANIRIWDDNPQPRVLGQPPQGESVDTQWTIHDASSSRSYIILACD